MVNYALVCQGEQLINVADEGLTSLVDCSHCPPPQKKEKCLSLAQDKTCLVIGLENATSPQYLANPTGLQYSNR